MNNNIIYIYLNAYLCFYFFNLFLTLFLFLGVCYSGLYKDLLFVFFRWNRYFSCVWSHLWSYIIRILIVLIFSSPDYKDSMFLYICLNIFLCFYSISLSFIFWFSISSFRLFPPFCFFCYNLMVFYVHLLSAYFSFCLSLYLFDLLFEHTNQ